MELSGWNQFCLRLSRPSPLLRLNNIVGDTVNFAFSPHSWDLVDNCHYTAIFSEVTLTLLVCDSVVNPSRICALI